jgi:hypothetical protein
MQVDAFFFPARLRGRGVWVVCNNLKEQEMMASYLELAV